MALSRPVLAACAAMGLTAAPARADVIYDFVMTEHTTVNPGPFSMGGQLVVTDEAARRGFDVAQTVVPGGYGTRRLDGLVSLSFFFRQQSYGMADFSRVRSPTSPTSYVSSFGFAAGAGGLPTGSMVFNDTETDWKLTLSGVRGGAGDYNSDTATQLCYGARCTFRVATLVAVPEPASLGLFGLGLLGLMGARRRRAG